MSALAPVKGAAIASMSQEDIDKVRRLEDRLREFDPVEIPVEHTLHAGLYARTICIPAGVVATGVLIKIATVMIVCGDCTMFVGDDRLHLQGYHVIPAGAGRKQACWAHTDTYVTMLFASDAPTVDSAECQFTDETDCLQSRQLELIPGESPCPVLP